MAQYLREIMTQKPVTVQVTDTVVAAARSMRDGNIGDVVVVDNDQIQGILTDRDIVVRALAEGRDPARTTVPAKSQRSIGRTQRRRREADTSPWKSGCAPMDAPSGAGSAVLPCRQP